MTKDGEGCFWKFIFDMHLYDSKGEALFKACFITASWIGGVSLPTALEMQRIPTIASLLLFSMALIMEYAMRLIGSKKIATRILPLLIVGLSIVCAFSAFGELVEKPFWVEVKCMYNILSFLQGVIWLDVFVCLLIDKPKVVRIESQLKNVEVR